jgi:hypothetical protein
MPSIDWFWFIIGIIVGKFALDFVLMIVMSIWAKIRGTASSSLSGV